jgi:hypothetical protein
MTNNIVKGQSVLYGGDELTTRHHSLGPTLICAMHM